MAPCAETLSIALVQTVPAAAGEDQKSLLEAAAQSCRQAADSSDDKPDIIVLPEYFADAFGSNSHLNAPTAMEGGLISETMSALAKELGIFIHAGTFLETLDGKLYNTTSVFDTSGVCVAVYRKLHCFESHCVPLGSGNCEADHISDGNRVATYEVRGLKIGCAACWDLRFPLVFAKYRDLGCKAVIAPSAFFAGIPTGTAFWLGLLKARAIDNGMFLATATLAGPMPASLNPDVPHLNPIVWRGVSALVDPFGEVVAMNQQEGTAETISATLDVRRCAIAAEWQPQRVDRTPLAEVQDAARCLVT
eukprot:TRINITY_DN110994_c0_g1_i1.p1 TRINITY_DN110994_c0_g1~~TRINITY_DN110994_c0_g1_i1.p1  ORF type:complete len:306 (-),score=44.23 TRINITY_DN110994_c0_g1_i1:75-992(-)